ncbi:MAG TPA: hypothetical protein PK453_21230 [Leptospiraceae bacterium]|nr:hypothetical protein [Leptospiraceae bacterium]HNF16198.1 hypothetical protein [Leptospiraceae bacterium]HNF22947.1 hypothetical protein [Leptospiraceae bacterium]HNI96160.1 hypothetical protein [Leptospiraceae bacterium]HNN04205.1 hypothetical protein [Leptospiraceae bacterium]
MKPKKYLISLLILTAGLNIADCKKKRLENPPVTRKCEETTGGNLYGKLGDCLKDKKECIPGVCVEGDCENGKGEMRFASGGFYIGDFKNGEFEGQGTLTYCTEGYYTGGFKQSLSHGSGKMYSKKYQYLHEGTYADDEREGNGKITFLEQNDYYKEYKGKIVAHEGTYVKSYLQGEGFVIRKDGKKIKVTFNNSTANANPNCYPLEDTPLEDCR